MFAKRDIILAQEYLGFLLLNLFDLFLTGWIFKHQGQEANGAALWILHTFGLAGFAIYKFLMVGFLIVICEVISIWSLPRARLVILGGCALYVLVVLWECLLIFNNIDGPTAQTHGNPDGSDSASVLRIPGGFAPFRHDLTLSSQA